MPPLDSLDANAEGPMKTMACTGPGAMVGIRVNVATVEQHGS
jgi:hypothetical protein